MQLKESSNTYREILQQPDVWMKEYELIFKNKENIINFFSKNSVSKESKLILTGAGTSAFIGNILEYILRQRGFIRCEAIATTDLITHPKAFFNDKEEVILVSFARSGNSPESLAAVNIANTMSKKALHIIITCNEEGKLATQVNHDNTLILLLPPETNDISLAMTSSFSTMLQAFLLLININEIENQKTMIKQLSLTTSTILNKYQESIKQIAEREFSRAIFLGSGELKGIAEECHLKLQELTDGKVVCKFDSFLGFRHGPKAVIDNNTILIYLFSSDEHVVQYEKDLVEQINKNNQVVAQIAVSMNKSVSISNHKFDLEMLIDNPDKVLKDYVCIPYVLIGQLLGFYKSLSLGMNPDNPSVSGNISRVVEGVVIYNNNL